MPAMPSPEPPAAKRSVADLQAEIEAAREDLVASLTELKAQTRPGALARRGGRAVAGLFRDEFGGVRPERVVAASVLVVAIVAWRISRRRRRG